MLLDADVEDLVEAVVTVEGVEVVAVVAAERTKRRNGMQTAMNPQRPVLI